MKNFKFLIPLLLFAFTANSQLWPFRPGAIRPNPTTGKIDTSFLPSNFGSGMGGPINAADVLTDAQRRFITDAQLGKLSSSLTAQDFKTWNGQSIVGTGDIVYLQGGTVTAFYEGQFAAWERATIKYNGSQITDADLNPVLLIKNDGKYYKRYIPSGGRAIVDWWGAIPQDAGDDAPAIQQAIDDCIRYGVGTLGFMRGEYRLSKGVHIRDIYNVGSTSEYVTLSLMGDVNSFDPGLGSGTQILLQNKDDAAFKVQRGKGCRIMHFNIKGQNTLGYTLAQMMDPASTYLVNNVSNAPRHPHAGIVIDPWYQADDTYPGDVGFTTETTRAGSTGIVIEDVKIQYFVVGICVSPAGMQNGEILPKRNIWIDHCKSATSNGDSQNRTDTYETFTSWGCTEVLFDSRRYAPGGSGCPAAVTNFNIAGGTKYLCFNGTWYGNAFLAINGHAEELYAIGGNIEAQAGQILLIKSDLDLLGSKAEPSDNILMRTPITMAQCQTFQMIGGRLTYYGKPDAFINIAAKGVSFEGVQLSSPIITSGKLKIEFCIMDEFATYLEDLNKSTTAGAAVTVSNINEATNTYQVTVSNTTGYNYKAYVYGFPKTADVLIPEYPGNNTTYRPLGRIESVSGTTVTIKGIPNKLKNGDTFDIYVTTFSVP